jgi:hypothetical protein
MCNSLHIRTIPACQFAHSKRIYFGVRSAYIETAAFTKRKTTREGKFTRTNEDDPEDVSLAGVALRICVSSTCRQR